MSDTNQNQLLHESPVGMLSSLLSNPEMLSKLNETLSNLSLPRNETNSPLSTDNSTIINNNSSQDSNNSTENETSSTTFQNSINTDFAQKLPEILSLISSKGLQKSFISKQQEALLLAIRPYLSERRCELIDGFMKLGRLGEILSKLT